MGDLKMKVIIIEYIFLQIINQVYDDRGVIIQSGLARKICFAKTDLPFSQSQQRRISDASVLQASGRNQKQSDICL